MTDYEMNWQSNEYREKYELLNARVQAFKNYLDDPVNRSFYAVQTVRMMFYDLFDVPERD
jgi:hypothetical protein